MAYSKKKAHSSSITKLKSHVTSIPNCDADIEFKTSYKPSHIKPSVKLKASHAVSSLLNRNRRT